MVQTPDKTMTLAEFLDLPETEPASEYIDGQIIQKPMPRLRHSRIQSKLAATIDAVLEPQRIAMAFPELRCTFSGQSIVPDLAVLTWNRIPVDEQENLANVFLEAPDWTIEVLSPKQSSTRVMQNILHCLAHGCQMGWLIDPDDKSVFAYPAKQEPKFFNLKKPEEILPVPAFARDFQISVGTLFDWLKVGQS